MTIRNNQIEEKAKALPSETPPDPPAGSGVFHPKTVSGVTEGFYKDDLGNDVQLTKNGELNVPPFAYNLTAKDEGTTIDSNVDTIDFVGTGVSATQTSAGKIQVNISAGEANTASNVGTGQGNAFKQKSGVDLQFRTIKAGSNVSVVETANEIEISTSNPSGEANTASNVGGGNALFKQKSGVDLQFRTLVAGTNITMTAAADTLTINSSGGGGGSLGVADEGSSIDPAVTTIDFVGSGVTTTSTGPGSVQVSIPGASNLTVRDEGSNVTTTANTLNFTGAGVTASLASPGVVNVAISGSGTNISVKDEGSTVESALTSLNFVGAGVTATSSSGAATITIPSGSGETNTASNVGSGSGVFRSKTGVDLAFKSLIAGSNVTITPGANDITIAATAGSGETNTASNAGSGTGIFKSKTGVDLAFKSLIAGSGVTLTPGTNDITIAATGGSGEVNTASNVGGGNGIFKQKTGVDLELKTLVAGSNVTITPGASTITIAATGGGSSTVQAFRFTLPQTGGTLASRLSGVVGLPSGWALDTANTAGEAQFSSDADTLVITWDVSLGAKIARCTLWQKNTGGPASTQGIQKIDISTTGDEKTKTDGTKAAVYLLGKGLQTTRDLEILIELS